MKQVRFFADLLVFHVAPIIQCVMQKSVLKYWVRDFLLGESAWESGIRPHYACLYFAILNAQFSFILDIICTSSKWLRFASPPQNWYLYIFGCWVEIQLRFESIAFLYVTSGVDCLSWVFFGRIVYFLKNNCSSVQETNNCRIPRSLFWPTHYCFSVILPLERF